MALNNQLKGGMMSKKLKKSTWEENQPDNDYLMAYLKGDLSPEKQHRLEDEMENNPFLRDALDGLSEMTDEQSLRDSVFLLQRNLKAHVRSRKQRQISYLRPKLLWFWVAILMIILFVFIVWWYMEISAFN